MAEVIDLSLSSRSINEAISALNAWKNDVRKKADSVCEWTANYAQGVASAYYSAYAGDNDQPSVLIEPYSDHHGYHVRATGNPVYANDGTYVGNSIMFLEFGAGESAGANNPIAGRLGAYPKSYSENYGTGEFAKYGEWHHDDEVLTAINGTNAMYQAGQDSKERMKQLIREEFG